MSSSIITKHLILTTPMAYGHIRLEANFACEAVLADPGLMFTIFAVTYMVPAVIGEVVGKHLPPEASSRIRVIGVGPKEFPKPGSDPLEVMTLPIQDAYQDLFQKQTVTCNTGTTYDYHEIPRATAIFVDAVALGVAQVVTAMPMGLKIINILPTSANGTLKLYGPSKYGGFGEMEERAKALMASGGAGDFMTAAQSILTEHKGVEITDADGLTSYDYELWPQAGMDQFLPAAMMLNGMNQATRVADANILFSTRSFAPESAKALTEWYEDGHGKKLFYVGIPHVIDQSPYDPTAHANSPFKPVFDFLDSQKEKSVILVSFGSAFYPPHAWQVETLYNTLLETKTPFIASKHPHMYKPLNPEVEKRIQESGIGLILDYVPQREILRHPSLLAFLSHGGANSTFESLLAGVRCIYWPFIADQPVHAAYLSQKVDCAWELLQVRTGEGARPPHRGGKVEGTSEALAQEIRDVLVEAKGGVGERKSKNLLEFRQKLLSSLAEGGETYQELRKLIAYAAVGKKGDV